MLERTASHEDCSIALEEPAPASIPWKVRAVQPLDGYGLQVVFADGTAGRVEMREMIFSAHAGVFAALTNVEVFQRVYVDSYAVAWPGELDLAPDAMYEEIRRRGVWVLH